VSPSDLGALLKPFVFLDLAEVVPSPKPLFGIHPHSGIATLTTVLAGSMRYEDTTGKSGEVPSGGIEWMRAGAGVWHDGAATGNTPLRLFQLWLALPAALEDAPAESQYTTADNIQRDGAARVILGRLGEAHSVIRAPEQINYFHVQLADGQRWHYQPPKGHSVAWLAVDQGRLLADETVATGELAVFDNGSTGPISLQAEGDTSFVIGTAVPHPHPLVLGHYSVHTSEQALARGEAEIRRIGLQLKSAGRL
jgi:redox-sensitive bicupin YhaK (pirin superfamily)